MHSAERTSTTVPPSRVHRARVAGLLAAVAAFAAVLGAQGPAASSSRPAAPVVAPRAEHRAPAQPPGPLGEADGAVPDATTVFDDGVPAVAKLAPGLRGALRRAAADAAGDGVPFVVDGGWRSPAYQARLLSEAVAEHGSRQEAARWVATPGTSAHVSGDAVDVGPARAAAWLSGHGTAYGLCQIYANEPWHYELRPGAVDRGCPAMYADPTHDPRIGGATR